MAAVSPHLRFFGLILSGALGLVVAPYESPAVDRRGLGYRRDASVNNSQLFTAENSLSLHSSKTKSFSQTNQIGDFEPFKALKLQSEKQTFDTKRNLIIAQGQVKAFLNGGVLLADSLELNSRLQTLHAFGRVSLRKGSQYFQASSFKYNFLKKDGELFNVYGVLDLETISQDLSRPKEPVHNIAEERFNNTPLAKYDPQINNIRLRDKLVFETRFGVPSSIRNVDDKNKFGSVRVSQLARQGRKKLITGSISRWRIQSDKIKIFEGGWKASKMSFTNDPYTPVQTRINAENVLAEEQDNGDILITTHRNRLIFEDKLSIPILRRHRIRKKEEIENRWFIGLDFKDRDGFFVGRNLKPVQLGNDYELFLQPQFLLQRAYNGYTNSYVKPGSSTYSSNVFQSARDGDMLGLEAGIVGKIKDWGVDLNANISTLNPQNYIEGSRYWGSLKNNINLPSLGSVETRLFGAYRYRAWNGSLGETDIYTAYGGYLEKKGAFSWGKSSNSYLVRAGTGRYQAETSSNDRISSIWRSNVYGSFSTSYPIWLGEPPDLSSKASYRYTPVPIRQSLALNTNFRSSLSVYGDGRQQNVISMSTGPVLTLGEFRNKMFDYTKLSITLGAKLKGGESPFDFDQVIDLGTLGIGLTQQIVGPLVLNSGIEMNIDSSSSNYGELINSNIELNWKRRSYDFGLYYNPYKGIGGMRFRLNDFNFKGDGSPFANYNPVDELDFNESI